MATEETILPSDPGITYSGRIDFSQKDAPRFDWPGVSIGVSFSGSYIKALLDDGGNDYNIIIDGKPAGVLVTEKTRAEYMLAEKLKNGEHSVLLAKRTEGYDGIAVFRGFKLPEGGKVLAPARKPAKKIEFIGDSITVGFGIEGPGTSCDSERKYKNNYLAYSQMIARKLGAEAHIVAVSGRGVVKNYGEKAKKSKFPMPYYFDKTMMNDPKVKWDFKSWIPDIVIINLGTNDFSAKPFPDEKAFVGSYLKLLKRVREAYGGKIPVYCVSGPAQAPPFNRYIVSIIEKAKDKNLKLISTGPLSEEELGCDWHPNIKASGRITGELLDQITENSK